MTEPTAPVAAGPLPAGGTARYRRRRHTGLGDCLPAPELTEAALELRDPVGGG